jgi:peroxiredoxin
MIYRFLWIVVLFPCYLNAQENIDFLTKKGIDIGKHVPKGLEIGVKAPVIEGYSLEGKKIVSTEVLKEKNIVLIFYRGKWCPVCNRYLSNLNDSLKYIIENNAEILVVGPETFENAKKTAEKTDANYTLIPDTSFKILTDYDVMFSVTKKYQGKIKTFLMADIANINNQEEAMLPVPATYIIGQDGVIKWMHFNYNYGIRATVKNIIENLR